VGRKRKQSEPDGPAGAPEWMVTFSDCMTLLLTFFVLLLSFSSFDEQQDIFRTMVIFGEQASLSSETSREREALTAMELVQYGADLDKGSEKPTLARGDEDNLKEETEPANFHNRKVFLISSDTIFWGKGTTISFQGQKILAAMASFLKEAPNRVVISESGQTEPLSSGRSGLERAWAVMEYLTTKQALDKQQFSISAASTVAETDSRENTAGNERNPAASQAERMLEIVLLERSIYN